MYVLNEVFVLCVMYVWSVRNVLDVFRLCMRVMYVCMYVWRIMMYSDVW